MEGLTLRPDDEYLGIVNELLTIKNNSGVFEYYNPRYYYLIEQVTQNKVIKNKVTKNKVSSKEQDKQQEFKSLKSFRYLSVKLKTLYNQIERAKTTTDEDTFILLGRQIKKTRALISKHLVKLRQDTNFKITRDSNKFIISYNGEFVNAKSINPYSEGVA